MPVFEVARVDHWESDFFGLTKAHVDPIILDLQVVACLMVDLHQQFDVASMRWARLARMTSMFTLQITAQSD